MDARRIFIALDISDAARSACSAHIESLRKEFPRVRVGWEKPNKLHITLKFLGSVSTERIGELQSAVERIEHPSFRLSLAGGGVFPSPSRPRIFWIGVEDGKDAAVRLHADVEKLCRDLGFEPESKRFHPHITIGRIRESSPRELTELHLNAHIEPVEFEVPEIVIYESVLKPTGSEYSALSRIKLLGS